MMKQLSHRASHRSVTARSLLYMPACLLLALGSMATCLAEDFFLPNTIASESSFLQVRTLDNEALALQAEMMRSGEMSAEHRALNYQWLAVQSGESKEIQGSKVFSRIAKATFKEYWREKRQEFGNNTLLPDSEGKFKKQYNEIDYDFRISGHGLTIGFQYEFE